VLDLAGVLHIRVTDRLPECGSLHLERRSEGGLLNPMLVTG
jgi:hypothetical protein